MKTAIAKKKKKEREREGKKKGDTLVSEMHFVFLFFILIKTFLDTLEKERLDLTELKSEQQAQIKTNLHRLQTFQAFWFLPFAVNPIITLRSIADSPAKRKS